MFTLAYDSSFLIGIIMILSEHKHEILIVKKTFFFCLCMAKVFWLYLAVIIFTCPYCPKSHLSGHTKISSPFSPFAFYLTKYGATIFSFFIIFKHFYSSQMKVGRFDTIQTKEGHAMRTSIKRTSFLLEL